MTVFHANRSTCTTVVVKAAPEQVYAAFMSPDQLIQWLPPGDMTGQIHRFEACVGGGYEMSLFYPTDVGGAPGKTHGHEDRVEVTFTALSPPHRIVEAVRFATDDRSLKGEMTQTIILNPVEGGTEVTCLFENIPPGVRLEDNDLGARQSLGQLAEWLG